MYRRVVFFQPKTLAGDNYQNSAGAEQRWAPWFALILSPAAKRYHCEVELLDARIQGQDWESRVALLGPDDILAVTVMTGHAIVDAIKASSIALERGAFVVWGGPHVTLFPEQTLSEAPVSAVVPGFGFLPFYSLIGSLVERASSIQNDPRILIKGTAPQPSGVNDYNYDGDVLPRHDLSLIQDWSPYLNEDIAIASRTINFITSEGCPRRCTFCSEPTTSGQTWATRPVVQAVNTASELVSISGANGLKLHDPNFFHDSKRAMDFADKFARSTGVPWAATLYPEDLLHMADEELKRFASFGLTRVLIGLESPIPEIVRLAGKRHDRRLSGRELSAS
jgi:anaerobic magnesium-protoporphyrin IX monomethyl ester cyclase